MGDAAPNHRMLLHHLEAASAYAEELKLIEIQQRIDSIKAEVEDAARKDGKD